MLPQAVKTTKAYSLHTPPSSAPSSPVPGQPYNDNFLHPYRPARQSQYAKAYAIRRKWRWWHYLLTALMLLTFVELAIVFGETVFLSNRPGRIWLAVEQYPHIQYKHIDTSKPVRLPRNTNIYHVTKEFGPASMGGMGAVLTALATTQQRHPRMNVSVIVPFYRFLGQHSSHPRVTELEVSIQSPSGNIFVVPFRVYIYWYRSDGRKPDELGEDAVVMHHQPGGKSYPINYDPEHTVPVYLIGAGEVKPFTHAFHAHKVENIYNHHPDLPQEWRDQFFCKAVAAFITWQQSADDESLFVQPGESTLAKVDVVHLHGATNAYVAKHLRDAINERQFGRHPPSIVYTLHDYLDELQYTNTATNVRKFLDSGKSFDSLLPYQHGNRVFMGALGIDAADFVTFVSKSMASDMVEGRLDFYLKELVMPSILRKAERGTFVGITNGVSFGGVNPFTHPNLVKNKVAFPPPPFELGREAVEAWKIPSGDNTKHWLMPQKLRVKQYLVKKKVLSPGDEDRPLVLFVGRFQYNKGLEFFAHAVEEYEKVGAVFVILGQQNNYPISKLYRLQKQYKSTVYIIADVRRQAAWGVYLRLAADFAFVPSLTESFGLVAAEGLLFGAGVISSGAGGLREFLVDRPRNIHGVFNPSRIPKVNATHNAYLFNPRASNSRSQLRHAIADAMADWAHVSKWRGTREAYVRRCVTSALALGWERKGGPIEEYARVYEAVIRARRREKGWPETEDDDEGAVPEREDEFGVGALIGKEGTGEGKGKETGDVEGLAENTREEDEEGGLRWDLIGEDGRVLRKLEDVVEDSELEIQFKAEMEDEEEETGEFVKDSQENGRNDLDEEDEGEGEGPSTAMTTGRNDEDGLPEIEVMGEEMRGEDEVEVVDV